MSATSQERDRSIWPERSARSRRWPCSPSQRSFNQNLLTGVYTRPTPTARPAFHRLPPPTDADIAALLTRLHRRVRRLLARRGRLPEDVPGSDPVAAQGLTIPAVLAISLSTGAAVEVGLEPVQIVLLALTLLLSIVNLGGGRTNILQGAVHLIVFLAYAVLIFD